MTLFEIKPLPWVEEDPGVWVADAGQLGTYGVERDGDTWEWVRFAAGGTVRGHVVVRYGSSSEAKAAADDYHREQLMPLLAHVAAEVAPDEPIIIG